MPKLIFEIGCEEIPARFIQPAIEQMAKIAEVKLIALQLLSPDKSKIAIKTYGTPRRLALLVTDLANQQYDIQEKILGPPIKFAYDEKGNYTKASIGFATNYGIDTSQLQIFSNNKGSWIGFINIKKGRPALDILSEFLPELVKSITFKKTMRWGIHKLRFVRPIHWFLALLDDQLINFELAGIKSSYQTYGHRFLSPKPIILKHAQEYLLQLTSKLAFVEIDRNQRKAKVEKEIEKAASLVHGSLINSTNEEKKIIQNLINEVTDLVEFPIASIGTFHYEFLKIPRPIIIAAMCEHQRYFPLEDKEKGNILPAFIVINNIWTKNRNMIVQGHERVFQARLADARFFLEKDIKQPLINRLKNLKKVVYHDQLGTIFEKVERLVVLANWLAKQVAPEFIIEVKQVTRLAKCDLVTEMVGEFPSLQGYIGECYANYDGKPSIICQAIREHYKPTSAYDSVSEGIIGAIVGIADRLDSICSLFGIGEIPTSETDPYALRRAAIGIIRTIIEKKIILPLNLAIDITLSGLSPWLKLPIDQLKIEITNFFITRTNRLLNDQGIPIDIVEAVLAVANLDKLVAIHNRALALTEMKQTHDFKLLMISLKRIMNILRKAENIFPHISPQEELIKTQVERELFNAYVTLEAESPIYFATDNYLIFLKKFTTLLEPIDIFFNKVIVMDKNNAVRMNRLALLNKIFSLFNKIAYFQKLQQI